MNWAYSRLMIGCAYLHLTHLPQELAALPAGVMLSEGQDVDRQT
jgi:hypothetical protein